MKAPIHAGKGRGAVSLLLLSKAKKPRLTAVVSPPHAQVVHDEDTAECVINKSFELNTRQPAEAAVQLNMSKLAVVKSRARRDEGGLLMDLDLEAGLCVVCVA
jgi:hypothetical protein